MKNKTICNLDYIVTDKHYIVMSEGEKFKVSKRVINNYLSLTQYISNRFFNKRIKFSRELNSYIVRFGTPMDKKVSQGVRICGFVSEDGIWQLQTPTLDNMLRMYFEIRVYAKNLTPKENLESVTTEYFDDDNGDYQEAIDNIVKTLKAKFIPKESKKEICLRHLESINWG